MKRLYIVTGANGHLGSTIIRYLRKKDCEIRGLILPNEPGECNRGTVPELHYYKGDISDIDSLKAIFSNLQGYEVVVIHTAGIISIENEVSPRLYNVNVLGTKNIVELSLRNNVHRMLYTSSVHAIPEVDNLKVLTEVDSFSPSSVTGSYAKTKAEASQAVLDGVKNGLNGIIVHPSGIVGPYDTGNNHLVQLIKDYISGRLPAGVAGGYDFVDVRDVAMGCIAAIDKGTIGECYILSNQYYTVRELLNFMQISTNGPRKVLIPLWFAKILVPVFEGYAKITKSRPLFTKYSLYTLGSNGHFSHEKATKVLGYQPRDIQTTIDDTVSWLQQKQLAKNKNKR